MFQRALVRAGVKVAYSQGFNPHLRMSLVLPRSVGVESDDEILCLWLEEGDENIPEGNVEHLKDEMPEGIEIGSVEISGEKRVPEPSSARYIIKVKSSDEGISERIAGLLAGERIVVERRIGEGGETKPVDVRPFLESVDVQGGEIIVDCWISPAGTIRVDEILDLLGLETGDLAEPVLRKNVQWGHNL
jgi:radical SAM-linked protein